jgi:L-rhamnose mutarotase
MERVGFVMRLLAGNEEEYRRRHDQIWPEMAAELKAAGARNYSIFLRGDELFGYLEVEDFARFRQYMGDSEVNSRWQAEMGHLINPLTDPETGFHQRLDEVFHLA